MAGGEGTRLRPLTSGTPKPLLPVVGKPLLDRMLILLKRHGISEAVLTLSHLAALVRTYVGDGSELGMDLSFATEPAPLGTAGSVRNAARALADEDFLVVSGDVLTDVDLTDLARAHRRSGAAVTVCLVRRSDPRDFGIAVTDDEGRIERFLEKPTWGQVITDSVNTGIYVMNPEVLSRVPSGRAADWARDILPQLISDGVHVHGHVTGGYWEDVGTPEAYLGAHAAVLDGDVDTPVSGVRIADRVWAGEGTLIDPDVVVDGPVFVGSNVRVERGARLGPYTVLGDNVVVRSGARLDRAVLHDNAFVGPQTGLRGCVIGRGGDLERGVQVEEGALIGEDSVLGEEAVIAPGVRVYPSKHVEPGAVVRESVVWESRGRRSLLGPHGISGIVNVDLTPELAVRLGAALASLLPKGAAVTVARDQSRAARAFDRVLVGALTAAAAEIRDLHVVPMPVARGDTARHSAAGVYVRTTPGEPGSLDLVLLDNDGLDLGGAAQQRLERIYHRRDVRRPFPGEVGDIRTPNRIIEDYARAVADHAGVRGVDESQLRVVVDVCGGTAALVLPVLLSRVGVDVLTINSRLDDGSALMAAPDSAAALDRLGERVVAAAAHFGAMIDPAGERLWLVDERGKALEDGRALLVLVDLVAAENRGSIIAVPQTTTILAEELARFHGVRIRRTAQATAELFADVLREPALVLAGDGHGGYVVPAVGPAFDALATFMRALGLIARAKLPVSELDARIPRSHVRRTSVAVPWASKGAVMRAVADAALGMDGCTIDTTEGVRVIGADGWWTLVVPDAAEARIRIWAEGADEAAAARMLARWRDLVESARSSSATADR